MILFGKTALTSRSGIRFAASTLAIAGLMAGLAGPTLATAVSAQDFDGVGRMAITNGRDLDIVSVQVRPVGQDEWSDNLLSGYIAIDATRVVRYPGIEDCVQEVLIIMSDDSDVFLGDYDLCNMRGAPINVGGG